jgi:hypothetical protein
MNCCFEGDPSPIFDFVVRVVERAFLGELGAVVCEPVWYPTEQQLIYVSACNSFAFVAYSLPLSPTANSTTRMFRAAQPQCLGRVIKRKIAEQICWAIQGGSGSRVALRLGSVGLARILAVL